MRVALVVTDLQRGGTPLRLARLARGLKSAGVDVQVGGLAGAGPVGHELERDGIATFACEASWPRVLGAVRRLTQHLKRIRPDLIHSTLTHANVACRIVGRALGIPVVSSTATIEVERRWHPTLERCTARLDRGHIVNSAALAEHVSSAFRVPAERIYIVPPFVDPWPQPIERAVARRMLDLPSEAFVVLWAGRFDPVKRLDLLLDAVALLPEGNGSPPTRESAATLVGHGGSTLLVLAGDGRLRPAIEARVARDARLAGCVRVMGWMDELSPALSAADVFAFPSLTEGTPNAVLTAMAAGLPIVGSAIPALRELAGAEAERLMLVEGDAAVWAGELSRLRGDAGLRAGLAERAGRWARENLDLGRTVAETVAVYERILGR